MHIDPLRPLCGDLEVGPVRFSHLIGRTREGMFCDKCGTKNRAEAKFCRRCSPTCAMD